MLKGKLTKSKSLRKKKRTTEREKKGKGEKRKKRQKEKKKVKKRTVSEAKAPHINNPSNRQSLSFPFHGSGSDADDQKAVFGKQTEREACREAEP